MKIEIVSDMGLPYRGGAEVYVLNLGKELIKLKDEVHWIYSKMPNTKSEEVIDGINCHRVYVPFESRQNISRNFFVFTMFPEVLRVAKNSDILQFNTFVAGVSGWAAGKLSRKPYLIMCYEFFRDLWKSLPVNKVEKIIYPQIEKFIATSPYPMFLAISNYTKRALIDFGVPEKIIKVIYLGVYHDLFHTGYKPILKKKYKLKNKKVIGWCGRLNLSYSKNLGCLLEAFKIIKKENDDVVLMFDGKDFEVMLPKINSFGLKLNKDVIYNGYSSRNQLPYFYSSCDIYALPSLSEGFGLAVAEAQACGTPVVCFNKGSLPEVVKDKKTGIIVKDATPEAFAEGINKLLNNEKLRRTLGRNGPKWVKQFNWEKCAKEHREAYEELISSW
jgi:glycosyltransferase involved in cell wall biosynthesis